MMQCIGKKYAWNENYVDWIRENIANCEFCPVSLLFLRFVRIVMNSGSQFSESVSQMSQVSWIVHKPLSLGLFFTFETDKPAQIEERCFFSDVFPKFEMVDIY